MNLETILKRNYDRIVDFDAIPAVIEFVNQKHTIPQNLRTAKRLTKLCRHIMREQKVSPQFVTHSYEYAAEALERDKTESRERTHLEAYAGDFALALAKSTGKIEWSRKAYSHLLCAAEKMETSEPEYAAVSYDRAADAAVIAAKQNPKAENALLERAYDARIAAAELSSASTSKAIAYQHAKEYAKRLACITNDDKWFKKAANACELFLHYGKKKDTRRTLRVEASQSEERGELDYLLYSSGDGQIEA